MSVGLIPFMQARIDEDEETARVTSRDAWREWFVDPWYDGQFQNDGRTMRADLGGYNGGGLFTGNGALDTVLADHIARQNPARALREVEAKRARLALLDEAITETDRLLADDDAEKIDQGVAIGRKEAALTAVKHDAAVWAGHPDYRAEWKP